MYADSAGDPYVIERVFQDSQGHRTAEVYDFCRNFPGVIYPTKGE